MRGIAEYELDRRLFRRERQERELEKELQYHLDRRIEELVAEGVNPQEAARRARIEFGAADEIKEACRDARGTRWVEDFVRDCRYGLRMLRRSPVFTSVAILSLALGIGACTAIFSLMDRVMFRMLPVRQPERLVQITRFHPPYGRGAMSYPLSAGAQQRARAASKVCWPVITCASAISRLTAIRKRADFDLVSGSYYPVLGVKAVVGRTFGEDADRAPGAHPSQ